MTIKFTLLSGMLLVAAILLSTGCGVSDNGPGGSEITNGIVMTKNGDLMSGLTVIAYPDSFIKSYSSDVAVVKEITDNDGSFSIKIDSGLYNLFVIDTATSTGAAIFGIGPQEKLGTILLERLGSIDGTLRFATENQGSAVVYCKGTPFGMPVYISDPEFRFDLVPPGTYSLSFAKGPTVGCAPGMDCSPGGGTPDNQKATITVVSDSETVIDTTIDISTLGELP